MITNEMVFRLIWIRGINPYSPTAEFEDDKTLELCKELEEITNKQNKIYDDLLAHLQIYEKEYREDSE